MKFQLLVFDLDDTLLDTSGLLIPIARTPAFEERIRQPLPLMPGAWENLEFLSSRYSLALLTQGNFEAQMQKVKSLGISHFFKELCFADPHQQKPKAYFFNHLIETFQVPPEKVLSIGNRRSIDIREAKRAGARTCLFNYGEHVNEAIEVPEDVPDFEIDAHKELIPTCQL